MDERTNPKTELRKAYEAYKGNQISYDALCETALAIHEREGEGLDGEVEDAVGEICRLHETWDMDKKDTELCETRIEKALGLS